MARSRIADPRQVARWTVAGRRLAPAADAGGKAAFTPGPRIYNLFPLLAGPLVDWERHLPRIAGMGFNWVYVNPFHAVGTSGGLYAIRDTERLHPVVQGGSSESPDRILRRFVDAARGHGLGLMADLVLDRTSRDSVLAREHPDWIVRDGAGRISPGRGTAAVDPRGSAAPGDAATIAWDVPKARPALIAHASTMVRRYLDAGIRGFRCAAAARVPAAVWRKILEGARGHVPGTLFAADTLARRARNFRPSPWRASTPCSTTPDGGISAGPGSWNNTKLCATSLPPSPFPKPVAASVWQPRCPGPTQTPWSACIASAQCLPRRSRAGS